MKTASFELTDTVWTDLGVGPMLVETPQLTNILVAVADTQPSVGDAAHLLMGREPEGRARYFNFATHVWAMSAPSWPTATLIVTATGS